VPEIFNHREFLRKFFTTYTEFHYALIASTSEGDEVVARSRNVYEIYCAGLVHILTHESEEAELSSQLLNGLHHLSKELEDERFPGKKYFEFQRHVLDGLSPIDETRVVEAVSLRSFNCLHKLRELGVDPNGVLATLLDRYPVIAEEAKMSVFLVHGTDSETVRAVLCNYLVRLGLTHPVILSEKAGGGETLIANFEANAGVVEAAIILLTGDDLGKRKGAAGNYERRARQNVWFEAGYFRARLGKDKTIFIKCGEVSIPTDILGIKYVDMGNHDWKVQLFKELSVAGVSVKPEGLVS